MKLGRSKHWSESLKAITGESELSATALLDYFAPLQSFLREENARLKQEDQIRQLLENHETAASDQCNKLVKAEWDVNTDVNNKTKQEILTQKIAENAQFEKQQYNAHFKELNHSDFIDERIQRQIMYLSKLGISTLDENSLNELTRVRAKMENVYSNGRFCDYDKPNCDLDKEGLTLDPGICCLFITIFLNTFIFKRLSLFPFCYRNYGHHGEFNKFRPFEICVGTVAQQNRRPNEKRL